MDKRDNKTPRIRFPEFKEDWEHKKLSDLLQVSKKKNKDLKYSKEEVLSVSGESGIVNQIEHMGRSYAGASVHNYGVVEVGDIVYTKSPLKSNPYGIIKLNKGLPGIVSTLYAIYKVKEDSADGEFIEHYFSLNANTNRYLRPLVRKGAKNDMKINNEYVLHDRVFFPKKAEQKRIAEFFSKLDFSMKLLKKKQRLLKQYKQSVMQKVFSCEIRFKNNVNEDFSKWERTKLKNVVKIYDGTHQTPTYLEKGIPFYSVEHVTANNFTKTKFVSREVFEKENKRVRLEEGDILMTRIGDIGTSRLIDWDVKASFYVSLALIKQSKDINTKYLNQFISSNNFQSELWKRTIHVAFPQKINLGEIGECYILLPEPKEQERIADLLSELDKKNDSIVNRIYKIKAYKKSLLQQMFCY